MSDFQILGGGNPFGFGEEPAQGSRIAGYRIVEQLGRGGMAVVFRAEDERLGRQVALKILSPALAADAAFRQRFIRESRAAAAVDDPHIIPVYEASEADGVLFIAMRYVSGGDVHTLIRQSGQLSASRTAAIISPVASALDAAHGRGLVHRDVKPANMLLDARARRPDHVYLSDFGLSKWALSATGLTASGQFLGTPDYVSPEQVAGRPADGRADQYALACSAFEMLAGAPPFLRDSGLAVMYAHASEPPPALGSLRPDLHSASAVLARALAKNPADRYPTCQDFADALRAAAGLPGYDAGHDTGPRPHAATEVAAPAARDEPAALPGSLGPAAHWTVSGPAAIPLAPDPAPTYPGRYAAGPGMQAGAPTATPQRVARAGTGNRRRVMILAVVAATVLAAAGVIVSRLIATGGGAPKVGGGSSAAAGVLSPVQDPIAGAVYALDAGSRGAAWASGFKCVAHCGSKQQRNQALILRWTGSGWTQTPSPTRSMTFVDDIAAGGGGSAWAVGYTCLKNCAAPGEVDSPVLLRWDGTAWSRPHIPAVGQGVLNSVITEANGTAWAVGSSAGRALILRYNSGSWTRTPVPSPKVSNGSYLSAVAAGPGGTAWAVGDQCLAHCTDLILHWDGTAWSQMSVPNSRPDGGLNDVTTDPGGDAWAAGYSCKSVCVPQIAHWDGTAWSQTRVPRLPSGSIPGVAATSADSAWAIALDCTSPSGCNNAPAYETLLLHWNGRNWTKFPYPGSAHTALYGLATGTGRTLWATGTTCSTRCDFEPQSAGDAVILRWNGTAWSE